MNTKTTVTRDVCLDEERRLGRVPEMTKARKCIVSRRRYTDDLGVEQWTDWMPWENIRDTGLGDTLILIAKRHNQPYRSGYAKALLEADWGDTDRLPCIVSGLIYYGVPRATREFAVAEVRETIELL